MDKLKMTKLKIVKTDAGSYRLLTPEGVWVGPALGHFKSNTEAFAWAKDNNYTVRMTINL